MSNGFVKIYGSKLLSSSIWGEPLATRVVWMTLLALADADGVVDCWIPGVARAAQVTIDDAEEAIERLAGPDKYSRTTDEDGRRIRCTETDGTRQILIINHGKYRAIQTPKQVKDAKRKAESRKASKVRTRPETSAVSARVATEAEAEAEAEADQTKTHTRRIPRRFSSLVGLRDPLGEHDAVSSSEYIWRAFVREAKCHGYKLTNADLRAQRRLRSGGDALEEFEAHCLEHSHEMAESRAWPQEKAFMALVDIAFSRFGDACDRAEEDEKPVVWHLNWVKNRWAEFTKGAIK